jgi:hypothetical protein
MKPYAYLSGLLVLGSLVAGCSSNSSTTPSSAASSTTYTAALVPSNEVPPISGSEAGGSGTATLTLNLTKDSSGSVTAASLDVTVSVSGFPPNTALTASHIHSGAPGVNGGIFVSFGLASGDATFATGSGSFTKSNVTMTADQANSILANPGAFYVNIHTAANPGGVARGQLNRAQ